MDLAPTALTLMQVQPAGMEGIALADAIASAAAHRASEAQAGTLRPVIDAAQRESQLELAAGY